ncbi:MAG: di-trans,poly-cis-decaprenylcistransferase, partial [Candidatus Omnitrophica bacterium]|nr:di-trans,poly-cis-decaprenylcistransferase [Candidatus Omnitrophota bacterium]
MPYHPSAEAQKLIDRLVGAGAAEESWAEKPLPKHVAIIMDGNGRWAGDRGLPRIEGHREGIQSVRAVAQACRKLEIPYLTLYAFSTENWKRPRTEIAALMKLLRDFLKEEIPEMLENRIRLDSIGNIKKLPLYVQHQLSKTSRATKAGDMMQLTLALSYGSRDEITQAVKKIARKTVQGKIKESQITQELVSEHLFTAGMPDPDLMIRSSGEL